MGKCLNCEKTLRKYFITEREDDGYRAPSSCWNMVVKNGRNERCAGMFEQLGPDESRFRCLGCGSNQAGVKLYKNERKVQRGEGYWGKGFFCTIKCGWEYGLRIARLAE